MSFSSVRTLSSIRDDNSPTFIRSNLDASFSSDFEAGENRVSQVMERVKGHIARNALLVTEGVMEAAGIGLVVYALAFSGGMTFFIPGAFLALFAAALYISQLHNPPKMKRERDEENESMVIDISRTGSQISDLDEPSGNTHTSAYHDEWDFDQEARDFTWSDKLSQLRNAQKEPELDSFDMTDDDVQEAQRLGRELADAQGSEAIAKAEKDQDAFLARKGWKYTEPKLSEAIADAEGSKPRDEPKLEQPYYPQDSQAPVDPLTGWGLEDRTY